MKLLLEVYLVTFVEEGFHVVRKELDITQENQDPDTVVNEYLKYLFQDSRMVVDESKYILHSTSWRHEQPNKTVLTYLVYSDAFSFKHLSPWLLEIEKVKIAQSFNPKKPRPDRISPAEVVSHGIRHIAFQIQNDEKKTYKSQLTQKSIDVFLQLLPQLAGRI